jgi:hypothetical protein
VEIVLLRAVWMSRLPSAHDAPAGLGMLWVDLLMEGRLSAADVVVTPGR